MYVKPFVIGALTYLPGFEKLIAARGTGGTDSARYCYGVWLKHLVMLWEGGMRSMPRTLAELGPGDTLGVGLAAMLSGVDEYYALDVIEYAHRETNLRILDELLALFRQRAPRPHKGWPDYDAHLDGGLFPSHILSPAVLEAALAPARIERIRNALAGGNPPSAGDVTISYKVPWSNERVIEKNSVDLILSHAVLQSVTDLSGTYAALYKWLKPGGSMSHQIDYTSFRTAQSWNGHWAYSDAVWRRIVGRRSFLINREPHSEHVRLMLEHGFAITREMKDYGHIGGIDRSQLAARWAMLSDDDLSCRGAFVQARKPLSGETSAGP